MADKPSTAIDAYKIYQPYATELYTKVLRAAKPNVNSDKLNDDLAYLIAGTIAQEHTSETDPGSFNLTQQLNKGSKVVPAVGINQIKPDVGRIEDAMTWYAKNPAALQAARPPENQATATARANGTLSPARQFLDDANTLSGMKDADRTVKAKELAAKYPQFLSGDAYYNPKLEAIIMAPRVVKTFDRDINGISEDKSASRVWNRIDDFQASGVSVSDRGAVEQSSKLARDMYAEYLKDKSGDQ